MSISNFDNQIAPFWWNEHESSFSVCLYVDEYKVEIFESLRDQGFEGSGYDWESLAQTFLQEQLPELQDIVSFDPEGSMFCAYSSDKDALKKFILAFKA